MTWTLLPPLLSLLRVAILRAFPPPLHQQLPLHLDLSLTVVLRQHRPPLSPPLPPPRPHLLLAGLNLPLSQRMG